MLQQRRRRRQRLTARHQALLQMGELLRLWTP